MARDHIPTSHLEDVTIFSTRPQLTMAKGSQLSQLKTALAQAGLTGQSQSGKKRKRSAPLEKDKEKKAAKLEEIKQRLNPFDTKVTKLKHDVGGRRLKGITGKPAKSKQAGIEQVRVNGLSTILWLTLTLAAQEDALERIRREGSSWWNY